MVSSEAFQYVGIVKLLLHFQWKWVGLISSDGDDGERFLQALEPMLSGNGICVSFMERMKKNLHVDNPHAAIFHFISNNPDFLETKTNVVVIHGDTTTIVALANILWATKTLSFMMEEEYVQRISAGKVWVTTVQVELALTIILKFFDIRMLHGALGFTIHSNELTGFHKFLQTVTPFWAKGDGSIKDVWEQIFDCSFPNSMDPTNLNETCTGEESLESVPAPFFEMSMTGHSYSIYNAVYALAHSLHAMYSSTASGRTKENRGRLDVEPWQLYSFLQRISFNNSAGDEIVFNDRGELDAGFDITNVVTFPNNSYTRVKVGRLDPQAPAGKEFTVQPDKIEWHHTLSQHHLIHIKPARKLSNAHPVGAAVKQDALKSACRSLEASSLLKQEQGDFQSRPKPEVAHLQMASRQHREARKMKHSQATCKAQLCLKQSYVPGRGITKAPKPEG
uniref:Uncharacterized protein n=1 Tax=Sphaerodactylus townsendi TaxID=933632 RepID=A0ACB8ESU8_9SAUR